MLLLEEQNESHQPGKWGLSPLHYAQSGAWLVWVSENRQQATGSNGWSWSERLFAETHTLYLTGLITVGYGSLPPHSFAHFPGLSPAPFYLEPTLNNSDSLWAPCSRRTWTSTSFLPSPGILHFHLHLQDTSEWRRRGRKGTNRYSFPLCAFFSSQQPQSNLSGLECRLKSCFDVCWISGKECTGGKKMWQICELQLIKLIATS